MPFAESYRVYATYCQQFEKLLAAYQKQNTIEDDIERSYAISLLFKKIADSDPNIVFAHIAFMVSEQWADTFRKLNFSVDPSETRDHEITAKATESIRSYQQYFKRIWALYKLYQKTGWAGLTALVESEREMGSTANQSLSSIRSVTEASPQNLISIKGLAAFWATKELAEQEKEVVPLLRESSNGAAFSANQTHLHLYQFKEAQSLNYLASRSFLEDMREQLVGIEFGDFEETSVLFEQMALHVAHLYRLENGLALLAEERNALVEKWPNHYLIRAVFIKTTKLVNLEYEIPTTQDPTASALTQLKTHEEKVKEEQKQLLEALEQERVQCEREFKENSDRIQTETKKAMENIRAHFDQAERNAKQAAADAAFRMYGSMMTRHAAMGMGSPDFRAPAVPLLRIERRGGETQAYVGGVPIGQRPINSDVRAQQRQRQATYAAFDRALHPERYKVSEQALQRLQRQWDTFARSGSGTQTTARPALQQPGGSTIASPQPVVFSSAGKTVVREMGNFSNVEFTQGLMQGTKQTVSDTASKAIGFVRQEATQLQRAGWQATQTAQQLQKMTHLFKDEVHRLTHSEAPTSRTKQLGQEMADVFRHLFIERTFAENYRGIPAWASENMEQAALRIAKKSPQELGFVTGQFFGDVIVGYGIVKGVTFAAKGTSAVASGVKELAKTHTLQAPVTLNAEAVTGRLYSGIPVDLFKVQKPLVPRVKTKGHPERQLTEKGLSHPVGLLAPEIAKVRTWEKARNAFLKKWRELNVSQYPEATRQLLQSKADKVIQKNMTPDDLAGILKEGRGIQIQIQKTGKVADHAQEWNRARQAIVNELRENTRIIAKRQQALKEGRDVLQVKGPTTTIQDHLRQVAEHGTLESAEAKILQEKFNDLSKLCDLYEELTREAIWKIENAPIKSKL